MLNYLDISRFLLTTCVFLILELLQKLQEMLPANMIHRLVYTLITVKARKMSKACVDAGFTSIMIDASSLPFEQNVEEVKKAVRYCHFCQHSG